ncbi:MULTISPECIES: hypothetical protein [Olivibacter]|uniref:Uncharacterized protein n=1 Tax=Olivibacter jilunii TaxID=985016 RepID=A0ABW6B3P2_9SPHI
MSEYSSLYINIQIKEEKLQHFFQEKPMPQSIDENWSKWWDSRKMYSKQPLSNLPYYRVQNNRAVFDQLLDGRDFGGVEHYDKNTERWTFIVVFFSENYTEISPMLSLLKQLATYQDVVDTGVAFIYDFFWDCEEVMAYLEFASQQALFKDYSTTKEIEPAILIEANRALEAAVEKFSQQFKE